jgi:hypothetical protein
MRDEADGRSAADVQDLSVDEPGTRVEEETCRVRDVLGLADASHRNRADNVLDAFWVVGFVEQLGCDLVRSGATAWTRTPMIPKVLPTGPPAGFDPVEHIDLPLHGWQEGEAGRRQRKPYDPWRKVNP